MSQSGERSRSAATATRLAAAWLALLAVGYAAGRILTDSWPTWDGALVDDLRGAGHGTVTDAARFVTALGGTLVLDVVFFLAIAYLVLRRRWCDVVFLVLASPGTVLLVQILKQAVGRPRPAGPRLSGAEGMSWPSGHASSSAALYGALLLVLLSSPSGVASRRVPRRAAICVTVALVAVIGVSRVYLGVHYPTDVLGSWALVGAWLALLRRAISR